MAGRTIEEAAALGYRGVVFKGGGECTLHQDLAGIIQIAAGLGLECGVVSNGSYLDRPELCRVLAEDAAYVRISIDGPNPDARRELHGVDDFDRICSGVRRLREARSGRRHPIVGASFCLDYHNRALLGECVDLGESLGLDYVLLRPPFCEEVGFPASHTPQQAARLRRLMKEVAAAHRGQTMVLVGDWIGDKEMEALQLEPLESAAAVSLSRRDAGVRRAHYNGIEHYTRRCPAAGLLTVVTADGEVYGCCCLRKLPEYCLGTVGSDGASLRQVLESTAAAAVLERMRRTECLEHCTHPHRQLNEIIEYLRSPRFHSSFI